MPRAKGLVLGLRAARDSLALDDTYQLTSNNYESFEVQWGMLPAPSCDGVGGGGDAGLTSPKTLCCN